MGAPYARNIDAPNTRYVKFEPVREAKSGLTGEGGTDENTGASPISRWLTFAFDHDDFASNPDATGYVARCQIPRGSIVEEALVRVDEAFAAAGPAADIDIGDGSDTDGWMDSGDLTNANTVVNDVDAAYMAWADASAGSAGYQYYRTGDTVDILWKNATAPTAGKALLLLKTISYCEASEAEW